MAKVSKKELLEGLERIAGLPIVVIGDLILDRYIWGRVERISPEAPVPVVEVKRTEDRLGGAGNVVRNLCNLGAKVSVCGIRGDDLEGQTVLALLQECGVKNDGVFLESGRPTSAKTRVIAHPQQIVRIDREDKGVLPSSRNSSFADLVEQRIPGHKAVVISDYAKGVVSPELMSRFAAMHQKGIFGRSKIPLVVDPHPDHFALYRSVTVAKPNRREAEAASGIKIVNQETAMEAAQVLRNKWNAELMMITLGEGGLVIADGGTSIRLNTVARQVFDVSGAGDTVTAVFTAALASGSSLEVAGNLSNIAAGIVVSEVGTVAVDLKKLKEEIEHFHGD